MAEVARPPGFESRYSKVVIRPGEEISDVKDSSVNKEHQVKKASWWKGKGITVLTERGAITLDKDDLIDLLKKKGFGENLKKTTLGFGGSNELLVKLAFYKYAGLEKFIKIESMHELQKKGIHIPKSGEKSTEAEKIKFKQIYEKVIKSAKSDHMESAKETAESYKKITELLTLCNTEFTPPPLTEAELALPPMLQPTGLNVTQDVIEGRGDLVLTKFDRALNQQMDEYQGIVAAKSDDDTWTLQIHVPNNKTLSVKDFEKLMKEALPEILQHKPPLDLTDITVVGASEHHEKNLENFAKCLEEMALEKYVIIQDSLTEKVASLKQATRKTHLTDYNEELTASGSNNPSVFHGISLGKDTHGNNILKICPPEDGEFSADDFERLMDDAISELESEGHQAPTSFVIIGGNKNNLANFHQYQENMKLDLSMRTIESRQRDSMIAECLENGLENEKTIDKTLTYILELRSPYKRAIFLQLLDEKFNENVGLQFLIKRIDDFISGKGSPAVDLGNINTLKQCVLDVYGAKEAKKLDELLLSKIKNHYSGDEVNQVAIERSIAYIAQQKPNDVSLFLKELQTKLSTKDLQDVIFKISETLSGKPKEKADKINQLMRMVIDSFGMQFAKELVISALTKDKPNFSELVLDKKIFEKELPIALQMFVGVVFSFQDNLSVEEIFKQEKLPENVLTRMSKLLGSYPEFKELCTVLHNNMFDQIIPDTEEIKNNIANFVVKLIFLRGVVPMMVKDHPKISHTVQNQVKKITNQNTKLDIADNLFTDKRYKYTPKEAMMNLDSIAPDQGPEDIDMPEYSDSFQRDFEERGIVRLTHTYPGDRDQRRGIYAFKSKENEWCIKIFTGDGNKFSLTKLNKILPTVIDQLKAKGIIPVKILTNSDQAGNATQIEFESWQKTMPGSIKYEESQQSQSMIYEDYTEIISELSIFPSNAKENSRFSEMNSDQITKNRGVCLTNVEDAKQVYRGLVIAKDSKGKQMLYMCSAGTPFTKAELDKLIPEAIDYLLRDLGIAPPDGIYTDDPNVTHLLWDWQSEHKPKS